MSWSYDAAKLTGDAKSSVYQLRLLLGDTKAVDQQFQDEELSFFLTQTPTKYGAAGMACRALSSKLSREADTVDKDIRTTLSARATAYSRRAMHYENMDSALGAVPYAGGMTYSDKGQQSENTDRVRPAFNVEMQENYIPLAPTSNETDA